MRTRVVYLESVVFILQVFDAQSLCLHLLSEEGRVHHLQGSCQIWRHSGMTVSGVKSGISEINLCGITIVDIPVLH